jgi:hypothetical protein
MKFRIVTTLLLLAVLAALELWVVPPDEAAAPTAQHPSQTPTPSNSGSLGGVRIF